MMGATIRLVVLLIFFSGQLSCQDLGYYWRDYNGEIPSDAIVGGLDSNSNTVYIGQGYLQNKGLLTAHITAGAKQLYVVHQDNLKPVKYVKILCGSQDDFEWVATTSTEVRSLLSEAVIAGHVDSYTGQEKNSGTTYVARINSQGGIKVGRINRWDPEGTKFYFKTDDDKTVHSFEVLVRRKPYCKPCRAFSGKK